MVLIVAMACKREEREEKDQTDHYKDKARNERPVPDTCALE